MEKGKFYFSFKGTVYMFDTVIACNWGATTMAKTPKQALSNLAYRYKTTHGYTPDANVRLVGELRKGAPA